MRKITLLIVAVMVAHTVMAGRKGGKFSLALDISPKASFGNTIFLNSNIDADTYADRYFFSPGWAAGGRVGISAMFSHPRLVFWTLYGEYMYSSISQSYKLRDYSTATPTYYKHSYEMTGNNMAFMLRTTVFSNPDQNGAVYFEIGTMKSVFKNISETNSIDHASLYQNSLPGYTPASMFKPQIKNLVFGIGGHSTFYSLGLRFIYGTENIMSNSPKTPVDDGLYNNLTLNNDYTKNYSGYVDTKLLVVQLVLEINLYILDVGNANCGKKRVFMFPMSLNNEYLW